MSARTNNQNTETSGGEPKMVKCPFCDKPMKKHAIGIQVNTERENKATIRYDNLYICDQHGHIIHEGLKVEVELP